MSVARFAFQACSFNHSDISPFRINELRAVRNLLSPKCVRPPNLGSVTEPHPRSPCSPDQTAPSRTGSKPDEKRLPRSFSVAERLLHQPVKVLPPDLVVVAVAGILTPHVPHAGLRQRVLHGAATID